MSNCSTDLLTALTPDGKRRCEECGTIEVNGNQINVRCTNAAIKEIKFEKLLEGESGGNWMWTCGRKQEWEL